MWGPAGDARMPALSAGHGMPRCPPAAAREDRRAGGLVPGEPPAFSVARRDLLLIHWVLRSAEGMSHVAEECFKAFVHLFQSIPPATSPKR